MTMIAIAVSFRVYLSSRKMWAIERGRKIKIKKHNITN
ncbi:hypothetical protein ATN83_5270 [Raoultella ornithinolytica]|nr:hypothetical protein ATN83_5270 [Raoultella ornithinolytica]